METLEYFDIHSHLNFSDYGGDLREVISRMREKKVWTTAIGTDLVTSKEVVTLAENNFDIFACIGIHPIDDAYVIFDKDEFKKLISHPQVVAVGECGLDYFRIDKNDIKEKERQNYLFKEQIEFALEYKKPLMIHSRGAYDELADVLSIYKKTNSELTGNIHFFSGDLLQANRFVNLGFTLSFAGPITFARDYDEVIRSLPATSIHAETDSPFASPVPYRGKRNEPLYVIEVVKKLAEIRGENEIDLSKILVQNAWKLFNLEKNL